MTCFSTSATVAGVLLLLMAAAPALADSPREVRQQLESCQTIREPEQRLACFDRLLEMPNEQAGDPGAELAKGDIRPVPA